jgi:hypothetical protein
MDLIILMVNKNLHLLLFKLVRQKRSYKPMKHRQLIILLINPKSIKIDMETNGKIPNMEMIIIHGKNPKLVLNQNLHELNRLIQMFTIHVEKEKQVD